jgi:hypothetical protein
MTGPPDGQLDIRFPLAGVDRSKPAWDQPARVKEGGGALYTAADARNVRAADPLLLRQRGGSRPGLRKYRTTRPDATGGEEVQHLTCVAVFPTAAVVGPGMPTINPDAYPFGGGTVAARYAESYNGYVTVYNGGSPVVSAGQPFLKADGSGPWDGAIHIAFSADGAALYCVAGPGGGQVACYYDAVTGALSGPVTIYNDAGFRGGMTVAADDTYAYFCANDGGAPLRVRWTRNLLTHVDNVFLDGTGVSRKGCSVAAWDA